MIMLKVRARRRCGGLPTRPRRAAGDCGGTRPPVLGGGWPADRGKSCLMRRLSLASRSLASRSLASRSLASRSLASRSADGLRTTMLVTRCLHAAGLR
jgi:hypothetical protein